MSSNPCLSHGCSVCCWETEMPLTPEDVERLTKATGREASSFSEQRDGALRLRNVDDGRGRPHCVFLAEDGRCGVYEDRPEGCRLYPLVWDGDRGKAILDHECPHREEFTRLFARKGQLERLVQRVDGP